MRRLLAAAANPCQGRAPTAGLPVDIVVTRKTGEVLFFEFAAKDLAQSQPVITVDDTGVGEGKLFECDEFNNTAGWPDEVCPTVRPPG